MLRATTSALHRVPRNLSVAPRFDTWNEKYEAWPLLRKMGKLAGTGFYIPPEWYYHFRMFPPISNNFTEERTLNPHNDAEPTQSEIMLDATREKLRDELSRQSRGAATEGSRYFNLYWVKKPLDQMERRYWYFTRTMGFEHETSIKRVVQEYHEEKAVRRRTAMIQAEEAKLTGKFITMTEAMTVLQLLRQAQTTQLAPHQYSQLAQQTARQIEEEEPYTVETRVVTKLAPRQPAPTAAPPPAAAAASDAAATSSATGTAAPNATSATTAPTDAATPPPSSSSTAAASSSSSATVQSLHDLLGAETVDETVVEAVQTKADNVKKLREEAMDAAGTTQWYKGHTPFYPAPSSSQPDGSNKSRSGKK